MQSVPLPRADSSGIRVTRNNARSPRSLSIGGRRSGVRFAIDNVDVRGARRHGGTGRRVVCGLQYLVSLRSFCFLGAVLQE